MKKKLIAVLLCVSLLFACAVPAMAAGISAPAFEDVVIAVAGVNGARNDSAAARLSASLLGKLTQSVKKTAVTVTDLDAAVDEISALLGSVYAKLGVSSASLLQAAESAQPAVQTGAKRAPAAQRAPADPSNFVGLGNILSKYMFIKLDRPEDIAALIASTCDFDYTTVYGDHGTVYIRVDIEKNPQIFNYAVFRNLVADLYARQGEEMLRNGNGEVDYLMSYEHIAGELALHAVVYAVSGELLRLTGSGNSRLLQIYRSAAVADLNVDESRLPSQLISVFGTLVLNDLLYNVLHAFRLM